MRLENPGTQKAPHCRRLIALGLTLSLRKLYSLSELRAVLLELDLSLYALLVLSSVDSLASSLVYDFDKSVL